MKRWTIVFKALANVNRLKIIKLLSDGRKMNVGEITASLKISFTATSNHLIMLQKLDVLEADGKDGHIFYSLNLDLPSDFAKAIKLFTN